MKNFFALFILSFFFTSSLFSQSTRYVTQQGGGQQNGTSWGDAYPAIHLQVAIDTMAANGGGEVWVAYGTYYPTVHFDNDTTDARRKSFNMRTNVAVYGGFDGTETSTAQRVNYGENSLNETILSGNLGAPTTNADNSYHVVYVELGVTNALLDGFTITDGNANHPTAFSEDDGAGVYARSGFTIQNSVIKNNYADDDGGGLFMWSTNVIRNCVIHSNTAGDQGGGVLLLYFSTYTDPQPVVEHSLIYNNVSDYGGGIYQRSGGISRHNRVIANSARYGGGIYLQNNAQSINNLIANNKANFYGGGLYLYYGGYATGNTIVSNDANTGGAGVNRQYGNGAIYNSIIWNNKTQVRYQGSGVAVGHCAVEGGFTGNGAGSGNVTLAITNTGSGTAHYPGFINPFLSQGYSAAILQQALAADWSLTCHSDCIDLGDTAQVPADVLYDLVGHPRILDGNNDSIALPDIGAYEYYPFHPVLQTICAGDTLWLGPTPLTTPGVYNQTLTGADGCDSIVALTLDVLPADSLFAQFDLCQGDTLWYRGQSFSQGGTYQLTTPAPTGCDTLITLSINILPTDTTTLAPIDVFENQDYTFFGQQIQQSGIYAHDLTNMYGCDSVIQQQITFIPVDTILTAGLCQGDTLLFGGQLITTGGNYYNTISGSITTDSVIQMQVVLFPADTTWLSPEVLPMGSSLPFQGTTITAPGTYYHTLTAQTGCDSILALQVYPRVYVTENGSGSQNGHGWNNAYVGTQLQSAINYVSIAGGGELWVAKGTYMRTSSNDRQLRFMIYSDVELYGGFAGNETQLSQRTAFGLNQANQTILSGDINNPNDTSDNSYFIIQQFNPSYVLIDGFIIRDASNPIYSSDGGGVILKPGGVLRNCVVINNHAGYKGGGVYSIGGIIENCTIQGNHSDYYGGGVLMRGGEIRNSLITHNTTNNGGAGIQAEMDHGLITGCTISHNTVLGYGWGGGLTLDSGVDTMLIENTTISHNQAVLGGGAFTGTHATEFVFADCHFHGNSAVNFTGQQSTTQGTGGGLLINSGRIVRSHFSQNTAAIGAGVRMLGDAVIDSSLFTGNNATVRGGGVFQFQQATLTGSTLRGNSSPEGGAVYLESGLVTLCLIDSNTSPNHGGGIYATEGVVRDCDLVANFAHHGGGIYLHGDALLEKSTIYSNRAHYNGAGVYNSSNDAPVINCVIFKNYARYHGGGLYNDVSNNNNSWVINTNIFNNEAGYDGGGVYGSFGGELINCNINRNYADRNGGGVYINNRTKIRNSVIWGNNGTQIHTQGTAWGIDIDTTGVMGGYTGTGAGNHILALDTLNDGNDTTVFYPGYIYPTTFTGLPGNIADSIALFASDWNLDCASALIDRGANSALPDTITHDLTGNIRFADGLQNNDTLVDLGPLEALFEYTIAVTLCPGDTFYLGNTPLTMPGIYTDTVTTSPGCDLTMTVHLAVLTADTGYTHLDICQGETIHFGTQLLSQPGQYVETFMGANGCDSVAILTLQVLPVDTSPIFPAICQGGVFIFNGQGYNAPGVYYQHIPSSGLCDSVIRIELTVNPVDTTPLQHTICYGDSVPFAGNYLSSSGTYQHVYMASTGCDSLVTLVLNVISPDTTCTQQHICLGDTVLFFGTPVYATGLYYHTLTSSQQCDSVVLLNLQVIIPDTTLLQQTICYGDTFDFFGSLLHTAGTYHHTLIGSFQCDSVIWLDLNVLSTDTTDLFHQMCDGETLNFYGTTLNTSGTYLHAINSSGLCDSIIRMNLTVFPLPLTPAISIMNDTLFSSATSGNQWLFQQQPVPGAIMPYLSPMQNGEYAVVVTDPQGCVSDTSLTALVFWISVPELTEWPEGVKIFPNPVTDRLHIYNPEATIILYRLYSMTGHILFSGELKHTISLDMHHLTSAFYVLEIITSENNKFQLKIMKH